ncbi:conserved hypothetical protein [Candidatus Brocadia pituitae]|nr:conserved hypothetical protein [Candidatus Brocadia pituitae]
MVTEHSLKNWQTKKLGEVLKLEYGKPLPKSKRKDGGLYPVYGANGEKDRTDEYYHDKQSIIVGRKGSAGEINLTEKKFWPLDVSYFVTFDYKKYDLNFLYYLLGNLELPKLAKGVKPGINRNEVYSIDVQIPPLTEQQRIVAILDEAFAAIATAKENAEKNLANARELFESYLQSVFANPGDGWEEKKLGEISEIFGGYAFKSGDFRKNGRYQVLRMGNVRPGIIRSDESPVFIENIDEKILSRSLLKPGDIIITQTGTRKKRDYGYTVSIDKSNYLLNQRLAAIRTSKNLDHQFFLYYSWSDNFRDQFFANETGTVGQGNVGMSAVTDAIIPLPPLPEQRSIVSKLDTLSAETRKLEAIYQQKLADLDELKKSILQKAFAGEL